MAGARRRRAVTRSSGGRARCPPLAHAEGAWPMSARSTRRRIPAAAAAPARRHWARYRAGDLLRAAGVPPLRRLHDLPVLQSIYFSLDRLERRRRRSRTSSGWTTTASCSGTICFWPSLRHNVIWVIVGTIAPMVDRAAPGDAALEPAARASPSSAPSTSCPRCSRRSSSRIVWSWIYNPIFGILNKLLDAVGLEALSRGWLGDPGRRALRGARRGDLGRDRLRLRRLPGRPAKRQPGPARSGDDRRRQRLAALLERDRPPDGQRHQRRHRPAADRRLQRLRHHLRDDRRRSRQRHRGHRHLHLQARRSPRTGSATPRPSRW